MDERAARSAVPISKRWGLLRRGTWILAHPALLIAAFGTAYVVATTVLALRKPPWNDELYTFYFARVHSIADLWRALETGADQAPPLSYLLTRASLNAFGVNRWSLRLPEIVAFLAFSSCLYVFVRRRTNVLYGLMALVLPSLTGAYYYAFEARPYALVLAFGALALVCWQLATEGVRRRLALAGLAVSLMLATSSHYYAILLLVPLGLGELTRTLAARKVDLPVWLAFAGALVPFAAFVQLIRASRHFSGHYWGGATSWHDSLRFFYFLTEGRLTHSLIERDLTLLALVVAAVALIVLSPAGRRLQQSARARLAFFVLVAGAPLLGLLLAQVIGDIVVSGREFAIVAFALVALAAYVTWRAASSEPFQPAPPIHEVVACAGFLFLPLAGVALSKGFTHGYSFRYTLPAAIAVVILPLALYRLEGRRPAVALAALAALAAGFILIVTTKGGLTQTIAAGLSATATANSETYRFLEENAVPGMPILVDNPIQFLELSYSPPPQLAPRFIYLADPEAALRIQGTDWVELGLIDLGRFAPLRVYRYRSFAARRTSFLALSAAREEDWAVRRRWGILPALQRSGRRITRLAVDGHQALYAVSP